MVEQSEVIKDFLRNIFTTAKQKNSDNEISNIFAEIAFLCDNVVCETHATIDENYIDKKDVDLYEEICADISHFKDRFVVICDEYSSAANKSALLEQAISMASDISKVVQELRDVLKE